jgi:hypothetical protein
MFIHAHAMTDSDDLEYTIDADDSYNFKETIVRGEPGLTPTTESMNTTGEATEKNTSESLSISTSIHGSVLFVDGDVAASGNGLSWSEAFKTIQEALAISQPGDEIWVADGIYLPGNSYADTFQLESDVHLYGGFNGTENSIVNRNWKVNETILTGDIDGDDNEYRINGVNISHVVTGAESSGIDGFTIVRGDAFWDDYFEGGGLLNINTSFVVRNCIFDQNEAFYGGAISNIDASITIENCIFRNNEAYGHGDDGCGGAIENTGLLEIIDSSFISNDSWFGGAISNRSNLTLTNCVFLGNHAQIAGAIISGSTSSLSATNCTFYNNGGKDSESALYIWGSNATANIKNSIFWTSHYEYEPSQISSWDDTNILRISHTNIDGGLDGVGGGGVTIIDEGGNIDEDPMFYILEPGISYHISGDSPCIDAGTSESAPTHDIDGDPRPYGAGYDMGADEFIPPSDYWTDDRRQNAVPLEMGRPVDNGGA